MRQHILNGCLAAALAAMVCLLGATAYSEVRKDIPHTLCSHDNRSAKVPGEGCEVCGRAPCDKVAPNA
ncbi:hypothetical protein [Mesorhizobium sp. B1-1-8]|uniref:hypothetical protein n=1 Tax=Mesorhizobium sp. B1-1-8 TaxID=2589976 RepID=UPI00112AFD74|nr:hypothetical protein [Mesorhizobium sp. B1-1-8]UCI09400.1 hypothetical protein FJ974_10195 [Mesorhizobium sp. B1-1-8]